MNYENTICFKFFKIKCFIEPCSKSSSNSEYRRDLKYALDWLKSAKKDAQRMENAIVSKNKRIDFLERKLSK